MAIEGLPKAAREDQMPKMESQSRRKAVRPPAPATLREAVELIGRLVNAVALQVPEALPFKAGARPRAQMKAGR